MHTPNACCYTMVCAAVLYFLYTECKILKSNGILCTDIPYSMPIYFLHFSTCCSEG
jgi:hypothetical protein